ncbi:uncharacterized protein V2V93DRAFT_371710 [Kockiozyma suomiensis]|uniref:uncharacterized protein n=1 Tax=Kockiozyma suomiensis TaxID=1337062 RepID=UPI003343B89D
MALFFARSRRDLFSQTLKRHPLLVKSLALAVMSASGELVACYTAECVAYLGRKVPERSFRRIPFERRRIFKLVGYGLLVAGPLLHYTLRLAGRISPPNSSLRRMRFFLSTLLLLPVLNAAHVASMAILGGARTWAQVEATVRRAAIPASLVTAPVLPLLAVLGAGTPNEDAWALACAGVVTAFATVFRAAWMASK